MRTCRILLHVRPQRGHGPLNPRKQQAQTVKAVFTYQIYEKKMTLSVHTMQVKAIHECPMSLHSEHPVLCTGRHTPGHGRIGRFGQGPCQEKGVMQTLREEVSTFKSGETVSRPGASGSSCNLRCPQSPSCDLAPLKNHCIFQAVDPELLCCNTYATRLRFLSL